MYHNFVSEEDIRNGIEFEEYSISPSDFEQDLIWLKENGYVTITSAELLYFLENKEPIPQKAVILSIDDGSWGVYTNAWPLLKKHGMKVETYFTSDGDDLRGINTPEDLEICEKILKERMAVGVK
jgi:peptidoglycan/xylan/chitin deacetylase (PgdA/CDA1 family)